MKKCLYVVGMVSVLLNVVPLSAFTNTDLMGNYTLSSFSIQYPGEAALTQKNFSSYSGRVSVSNKAFLMEMSGYTGELTFTNGNAVFIPFQVVE